MVAAVALASFLAFVATFHVSGLLARAQGVIGTTREALRVIADDRLSDDEKESRVQKASGRLLSEFFAIALRMALVLAAPAVVLWGAEAVGLAPSDAVIDFLLTWPAIVGFSLVGTLALVALRRT